MQTVPEQVDVVVVELHPVVSQPPGAALTSDLTRLPHTSRIHTCAAMTELAKNTKFWNVKDRVRQETESGGERGEAVWTEHERSGHLQLDKWNKRGFISIQQRSASKIMMWTPDWGGGGGGNKQQQAAQLPLLMV